jgi:hypothetical protein
MKAETSMWKLLLAALLVTIVVSSGIFAASNDGGPDSKVQQPEVLMALWIRQFNTTAPV